MMETPAVAALPRAHPASASPADAEVGASPEDSPSGAVAAAALQWRCGGGDGGGGRMGRLNVPEAIIAALKVLRLASDPDAEVAAWERMGFREAGDTASLWMSSGSSAGWSTGCTGAHGDIHRSRSR